MSDRRRFLKGLTSLPLATVLANPRLAAAFSAGLQEVEAKLADGRAVKAALAKSQGQAKGIQCSEPRNRRRARRRVGVELVCPTCEGLDWTVSFVRPRAALDYSNRCSNFASTVRAARGLYMRKVMR